MKPEIVIFDLGKVLVDFDYSICARKLSAKGKLPPEEVQRLIDHSPLLFRYETGQIDRAEFHREICKLTGYGGTLEEFGPAFSDIFTPIEPMIALHAELRRQNIPTFILSNTNDLAAGHIRRAFPFFSNFDAYIFSFEQRVMKPDPRIYEITERITGRRGAQILYLDDRLENVEPARQRGWHTAHHQKPTDTIRALQQLGLVPQRWRP
jgi:FMN phosphatase YigB (HAD superfamily)